MIVEKVQYELAKSFKVIETWSVTRVNKQASSETVSFLFFSVFFSSIFSVTRVERTSSLRLKSSAGPFSFLSFL